MDSGDPGASRIEKSSDTFRGLLAGGVVSCAHGAGIVGWAALTEAKLTEAKLTEAKLTARLTGALFLAGGVIVVFGVVALVNALSSTGPRCARPAAASFSCSRRPALASRGSARAAASLWRQPTECSA